MEQSGQKPVTSLPPCGNSHQRNHSFCLFSKLTFPEYLLCARYYSRCQKGPAVNKTDKISVEISSFLMKLTFYWWETDNNQIYIQKYIHIHIHIQSVLNNINAHRKNKAGKGNR